MKAIGAAMVLFGLYVMVRWAIAGDLPTGFLGVSTASAATQPPAGAGNGSGSGGGSTRFTPQPASFPLGGGSLPELFTGRSAPFSGYGQSLPGIGSADALGLAQYGSTSGFANDLDYGVALGTSVYLPTAATYLGNNFGAGTWGNLLYFRLWNGGVFGLPHLGNLGSLTPGTTYSAGTYVGTVGGTCYSNSYCTAPHLSIIMDSLAQDFLIGLQSARKVLPA